MFERAVVAEGLSCLENYPSEKKRVFDRQLLFSATAPTFKQRRGAASLARFHTTILNELYSDRFNGLARAVGGFSLFHRGSRF
jgi:hypothetical protein